MSEIGKEVRRLREKKGWSQAQLAVYAGSSQPTVNQIESGKRNPSTRTLEKLAEALDVEVGQLFPKEQASLPFEEADEEALEERRVQAFLAAYPSEEERAAHIEHVARLLANYAEDWLLEIRDMEKTGRLTYGKHIVFEAFQERLEESLRDSGLLDYAGRVEERKEPASQREWEAADALLDGLLKLHNLGLRAAEAERTNHRAAGVEGTYEPKRTMRHFGDAVRPVGPDLKVLQGGKTGRISA
ncbi:MAG: helix-turn-helix transcriptional regulator [Actinomycetota bacterium]|nr:helix-turn-helix transcriptional regulator [Actinomycetota bacterium]